MHEEIVATNLDLEKMSEDTEKVQKLQPLKQVSIREQMKLPEGFYKVTPDCRIVSISQPNTVQKKSAENLHLESDQTNQAKRQTEKKNIGFLLKTIYLLLLCDKIFRSKRVRKKML